VVIPFPGYNLRRVLKLVIGLIVVFSTPHSISELVHAVVFGGLISLNPGFALQTPISSFIGWIYIMVRTPYRVGDPHQDRGRYRRCIDVSYIDTTLWIRWDRLSTDHPTGRILVSEFASPQHSRYNTRPLFPTLERDQIQHRLREDLEFVATPCRGCRGRSRGTNDEAGACFASCWTDSVDMEVREDRLSSFA